MIERSLIGEGMTVETNSKKHTAEGVQWAEFDTTITGKIGTVEFRALIECRDRPSQGAAPRTWIDQLASTAKVFGYHRVIAVSTTGFSPGAVKSADLLGVELRTFANVKDTNPVAWLAPTTFLVKEFKCENLHATIFVRRETSDTLKKALGTLLKKATARSELIVFPATPSKLSFVGLFWKMPPRHSGLLRRGIYQNPFAYR